MLKSAPLLFITLTLVTHVGFAGDFYLKVDPGTPPGNPEQIANVVIEDEQLEEQRPSPEGAAIETALSQFEDAEIDLQPILNTDPNFQHKLNARRQLEIDRKQLIADMTAEHLAQIAVDRAHIHADIALLQQLQIGVVPGLPTARADKVASAVAAADNSTDSTTGTEQ